MRQLHPRTQEHNRPILVEFLKSNRLMFLLFPKYKNNHRTHLPRCQNPATLSLIIQLYRAAIEYTTNKNRNSKKLNLLFGVWWLRRWVMSAITGEWMPASVAVAAKHAHRKRWLLGAHLAAAPWHHYNDGFSCQLPTCISPSFVNVRHYHQL